MCDREDTSAPEGRRYGVRSSGDMTVQPSIVDGTVEPGFWRWSFS